MAGTGTYRIGDEPLPGPLQRLAVNPLWPLLTVMFGGSGLSWAWFVLNGHALGSPTRRHELALAAVGLTGSVLLVALLGRLAGSDVVSPADLRYALVGVTVWKLAITYRLYLLQIRCFGLYVHFGGKVGNGAILMLVAVLLNGALSAKLPPFLRLVLG